MEMLKDLKHTLINEIQAQTARGLNQVDIKELGEAVDIVKDIEEIVYYCSITEAMEEQKKDKEYQERHQRNYPMYYDGSNYNNGGNGRMYYNGNGSTSYNYDTGSMGGNNYRGYSGWVMYPTEGRDYREGRSYQSRRNYMESKEMHHGKEKQMQELDKYVQELSTDVLEMIHGASPEEKTALSQKISALASKIQ